ncbi:MAG: hypothetical protein F6J93_14035 [Oscillatoria sp. SIO1A7]|nr:hypothetical protein [Oscillatoria sp. SIO1A7]
MLAQKIGNPVGRASRLSLTALADFSEARPTQNLTFLGRLTGFDMTFPKLKSQN